MSKKQIIQIQITCKYASLHITPNMHQQSQTTDNCPTSHGSWIRDHLDPWSSRDWDCLSPSRMRLPKYLRHCSRRRRLSQWDLPLYKLNGHDVQQLIFEETCSGTFIFTWSVKAKQGNVVPVHSIKAYTGKYSTTYFNIIALLAGSFYSIEEFLEWTILNDLNAMHLWWLLNWQG